MKLAQIDPSTLNAKQARGWLDDSMAPIADGYLKYAAFVKLWANNFLFEAEADHTYLHWWASGALRKECMHLHAYWHVLD